MQSELGENPSLQCQIGTFPEPSVLENTQNLQDLHFFIIMKSIEVLTDCFAITFRDVNSNTFGERVVTMDKLPKLTAHRALQHGLKEVINHEGAVYIFLALRKLINLDEGLLVNSQGNKFCSAHSLKFYQI